MERYINPFIDYGFKKLFATENNKDILISFLNAVIENTKDPIVDLTYRNVEQIGEFNGERSSYFDVFCQTSNGHQFIVEMQNSWQPFFKDRTLYYAAKAIREQNVKDAPSLRKRAKEKKKRKKWDYHLNEVYLIAVMNFTFPDDEYGPDDYCHRVMLTDLDDQHVFYDKLTLIYLEMPKVGDVELDMNRPLDRWLKVLYLLWGEEDCPPELDEPVFRKLYREAEYARLTENQQNTYESSWMRELDIYNQIEGGRILGHKEGLKEGLKEGHEEGFKEGREEGRTESAKAIAQKMLAMGMEKSAIIEATGITPEMLIPQKDKP